MDRLWRQHLLQLYKGPIDKWCVSEIVLNTIQENLIHLAIWRVKRVICLNISKQTTRFWRWQGLYSPASISKPFGTQIFRVNNIIIIPVVVINRPRWPKQVNLRINTSINRVASASHVITRHLPVRPAGGDDSDTATRTAQRSTASRPALSDVMVVTSRSTRHVVVVVVVTSCSRRDEVDYDVIYIRIGR